MKRKVLVVVAVISAFVLTGCSQVNTAGRVGKKEITNKEVQTTINQILQERRKFDTTQSNLPTGAQLNLSAFQFHFYSALFDAIAAGAKLQVTDGDIAKERAAIISQVGGEDRLPSALAKASIAFEDFPRYLRSVVIVAKIKEALAASGDTSTDGSGLQKVIIAAGQREGVEVNPRYGKWNATSGSLEAPTENPAIAQLK